MFPESKDEDCELRFGSTNFSEACRFRNRKHRTLQKIRCYRTAALPEKGRFGSTKVSELSNCCISENQDSEGLFDSSIFFSKIVGSEFVAIEPLGLQKMETAKSSSGEEWGAGNRRAGGAVGRGRQGRARWEGAGAGGVGRVGGAELV